MGAVLPVDILVKLVEDLISQYETWEPKKARKFIPRWYLLPLLRVSKLWYGVCLKYLYQTIAVGNRAPFQEREGSLRFRRGHEVTDDLFRTLSTHSMLATLVTKLQLGIDTSHFNNQIFDSHLVMYGVMREVEWTQTHVRILELCPNLRHLEIQGFEEDKVDALVDMLKKKSLVSFSVRGRGFGEVMSFTQILDMMQKWPNLQSIRVEVDARLSYTETEDLLQLDKSKFSGCCPDLREIITFSIRSPNVFRALRLMCSSGISKLCVLLYRDSRGWGDNWRGESNVIIDAFCKCLTAWAPTIEYLRIVTPPRPMFYQESSWPLNTAISTLKELRELQLYRMNLDFGSISNLPRLRRFSCLLPNNAREELQSLSRHLEDMGKFPSLNHILIFSWEEFPSELQNICCTRNIQLQGHRLTFDIDGVDQEIAADFVL